MICAGIILEMRNMREINYLGTTKELLESGCPLYQRSHNHRTRCLLFLTNAWMVQQLTLPRNAEEPGLPDPQHAQGQLSENLGNRRSQSPLAHASV